MNCVQKRGQLVFNGRRISIYPNFSAAVQKKRKLFAPVKKKLQVAGIRYAMQHTDFLSGLELNIEESPMKWLRVTIYSQQTVDWLLT